MNTIKLETKRMSILRRLINVEDEVLLDKIEKLLSEEKRAFSIEKYSQETLVNAVLRSKEDIENGNTYSQEQMRDRHPWV
jgi:hypothetical protein